MSSLSVIVPVYNEENFLEASLERLLDSGVASQIIISDDGSTDNSIKIAEHYSERYDHVHLILSQENGGKGAALNRVKNIITSEFVTIHDSDLEYFPEDLIPMYSKVKEYPESLIIGSRFIGSLERNNIYVRTDIANRFISLFFSLVHQKRITDIATCYKMMSNENFQRIELLEKGFSIEIEIVAKYLKTNRLVYEVPIRYHGRSYEEGKKITTVDGFKYLYNTLKYKIYS